MNLKQEHFILELPRSCVRTIMLLLDEDINYQPNDENKYALWSISQQTNITLTLKNSLSKLSEQVATIVDPGELWTPPNTTD